ncbi:hypothetical protein MSAN_01232700 [Mycena sanguinolenta]|uniref:F-box domain-containing protein n=1 Tax=Mycena sanguinolenta TaxID=230812 RepID=A0A8H6YD76_9AGAR|nr:hypothetical protein MSAN_01232700 [Mycena sanguinolenta]
MAQRNPLCIAELVDACISYLSSPRDLKACALVSRLWVGPAQSRLFSNPSILKWHPFLNRLSSSPHLIRHVRHLYINLEDVAILKRIAAVHFTHLRSIVVIWSRGRDYLPIGCIVSLQQLFCLPALRRISLHCSFYYEDEYAAIWNQCSPSIKDITLDCWAADHSSLGVGVDVDALHPKNTSLSPQGAIALQSLRMCSLQMLDYALIQKSCAFNLSKLKFLSIGWGADVPWPQFSPAVRSIEGLDIAVNDSIASLVLSAFPNLTSLEIYLGFWIPPERRLAVVDQLFSTLSATNTLQKIVICPNNAEQMDGALCTMLDAKLSIAPMSPTLVVELEVDPNTYEGIWPLFPTLNTRNSLRRADRR